MNEGEFPLITDFFLTASLIALNHKHILFNNLKPDGTDGNTKNMNNR